MPTQTRGSGTSHELAECVESRDICTRPLRDFFLLFLVFRFPAKTPKKRCVGRLARTRSGRKALAEADTLDLLQQWAMTRDFVGGGKDEERILVAQVYICIVCGGRGDCRLAGLRVSACIVT